jgi:hypothetical protein
MYGLFLYTCEAIHQAHKDVVFFSPPQMKVHARALLDRPQVAGKAWVMGKPDMVEAAQMDTGDGGVRWNHNIADAYWVARTAARFWLHHDGVVGVSDLTVHEQKQFTEIQTIKRGKRAGPVEIPVDRAEYDAFIERMNVSSDGLCLRRMRSVHDCGQEGGYKEGTHIGQCQAEHPAGCAGCCRQGPQGG